MKTEQELANELDAFLTARLKGQPAKPPDTSQSEAQLANALFDLAAKAEPDPVFLSNLEAHLAHVASRQQREKKASERPSFWQQLLKTVEESLMMRRTVFALGTIVALIIVSIFALNVLLPEDGTEPSAIAVVPTLASEAVVPIEGSEETAVAEALPSIAQTLIQPTPDTSNLASLPSLNSGGFGGGGGFGGDGSDIASSVPFTDENGIELFKPFNPLSGTIYLMNSTLPVEPAFAGVYEQPGGSSISLEDVRRFANLFGMNGEIYMESFPLFATADGQPAWIPPTNYFVFDGSRTLSVWETSLQYYDQSSVTPDFTAELMPYEQAAPIAEAFLQERGLLDFDYQIVPPQYGGNEVTFHRLVDGRSLNTAEYTVTVNPAGQILSVYYNPLNQLQLLGEYPLRSAESAWQQLISEGIDYQHSYYLTYPGPGYEFPEPEPVGDIPYKYWQRTYEDGDTVDIHASPLVYQSVESNAAPRIQADQFILAGSDDVLRTISEQVSQQLRLTGIARRIGGSLILEVTDWQLDEYANYQYEVGTIRLSEGQTLFDTDSGETLLIPNAPADLADGERVNVNGWSIDPGDPYPIFNWQSIDRYIDYEALAADTPLAPDLAEPYQIRQIDITTAELIYAYVPFAEEGQTELRILLQPAWRFKGTTDTNEIIEFVVQAVTDEFLSDGQ